MLENRSHRKRIVAKSRKGGSTASGSKRGSKERYLKSERFKSLSTYQVLISLFVFRLVNALTTKTFFQADEFYQCLEPAYNVVFGTGYMTWEWKENIRSSVHPLIYAIGYYIASLFGSHRIIELMPKVIGALIGSIAELYTYKFAQAVGHNETLARTTLALSVLSPFNWFFITRSFSNAFEMLLTVIALTYWPWNGSLDTNKIIISCFFAFTSCIVRPTNGIIWFYLGAYLLYLHYRKTANLSLIVKLVLVLVVEGSLVLLGTSWLDYKFYGKITFPLYNFLEFNVFRNLSVFYGKAPWHFYILQGIPLILLLYLPWFVHSLVQLKAYRLPVVQMSVVVLLAFSIIPHKEVRFIYPLSPVFLLLTALSFSTTFLHIPKIVVFGIIFANAVIAFFFTRVHERGVIDVIDYLRSDPSVHSFGFLCPCHSTPWQSHIHNATKASASWFISCEPPLHLEDSLSLDRYKDESDIFYDDPSAYLQTYLPALLRHTSAVAPSSEIAEDHIHPRHFLHEWPTHVIIFEPLEETMDAFFKDSDFKKCGRFFNSYFHWDNRRTGDLVLYCNTTVQKQESNVE